MKDKFEDNLVHEDLRDLDFEDLEDEELEDYKEFVLTLEDDSEINCLVIAEFDVDDQSYIALLPLYEDNSHGKILLYRANFKDEETFDVSEIETDEEFEKVSQVYYDQIGIDEADFTHSEDCDCEECSHDHNHNH